MGQSQQTLCSCCRKNDAIAGCGDLGRYCLECLITQCPESYHALEDSLAEDICLTLQGAAIALLQMLIFSTLITSMLMWPHGIYVIAILGGVMSLVILFVNVVFWIMTPIKVRVRNRTIIVTTNGFESSYPISSLSWREGSTLSGWFPLLLPIRRAIILTKIGTISERWGNPSISVGLSETRYRLWKNYLLALDIPQSTLLGNVKRKVDDDSLAEAGCSLSVTLYPIREEVDGEETTA